MDEQISKLENEISELKNKLEFYEKSENSLKQHEKSEKSLKQNEKEIEKIISKLISKPTSEICLMILALKYLDWYSIPNDFDRDEYMVASKDAIEIKVHKFLNKINVSDKKLFIDVYAEHLLKKL